MLRALCRGPKRSYEAGSQKKKPLLDVHGETNRSGGGKTNANAKLKVQTRRWEAKLQGVQRPELRLRNVATWKLGQKVK